MLGLILASCVTVGLAGACMFVGSVADGVRGLDAEGDVLWPRNDRGWG